MTEHWFESLRAKILWMSWSSSCTTRTDLWQALGMSEQGTEWCTHFCTHYCTSALCPGEGLQGWTAKVSQRVWTRRSLAGAPCANENGKCLWDISLHNRERIALILLTALPCPFGHQMDTSRTILLLRSVSVIQSIMTYPEQPLPGGAGEASGTRL